MKKKNFLRNLSATALAMCCLSSAVAFSSYASFEESNEENLGNIAWLFEEDEKDNQNLDLAAPFTINVPIGTKAEFPIEGKDGKVTFVGDNSCKLILRGDNPNDPHVTVAGSLENNHKIVFIPPTVTLPDGKTTLCFNDGSEEKLDCIPFKGQTYEVTGIRPDAKFPDTKTLVYPCKFESDKNAFNMWEIAVNNPEMQFAPYGQPTENEC